MARKPAQQTSKPAKKRAGKRPVAPPVKPPDRPDRPDRPDQPGQNAPDDNCIIIKRYGNRRLYNTETGSYVTYQDLIGIIRSGHDIRVIDSTTKADVTKSILIQAILEEEKNQKNLLPLPFLFQVLRSREDAVQDFFKNYLTASFEAYLKTKEEFDRRFRGFLQMGATAPQMWDQFIPGAQTLRNILNPAKKDKEEPK